MYIFAENIRNGIGRKVFIMGIYRIYIFLLCALFISCSGSGDSEADVSAAANEKDAGVAEVPLPVVAVPQFSVPQFNSSDFAAKVKVDFSGNKAQLSELPYGVSAEVSGADVLLRSNVRGVEYIISGKTDNGALTVISEFSPLVTLDSVSLVSSGKNALQISSKGIIYMRTLRQSRVADVAVAKKADNQSAALKFMGKALLLGSGKLIVEAERRSGIFCTDTLFVDGADVKISKAPNNAVLANGAIVTNNGRLTAYSQKDVIKCKKGSVAVLGGKLTIASHTPKADGVQAMNYYQKGGKVNVYVSGAAADGVKCDNVLAVSGGLLDITTDGDAVFNNKKSDYSSASCLKSGNIISISGGKNLLRSNGDGAKGISSDSAIVISGGVVMALTKGTEVCHEIDINAHASAKGIKSDGALYITGGDVEALVFGKGERNEGIEAKGDMYFANDAAVYAFAYDDAINAGNLNVYGGTVYAYSVANDAVDSNGLIDVRGGTLIADGSFSPEQGVDTDDNSVYSVTGGTVVSVGGTMGPAPCIPMSKRSTVCTAALSGIRLEKGKFLSLVGKDGSALLSYKLQRSMADAGSVFASSLINKNGSYSFVVSDSIAGGSYLKHGLSCGSVPVGVVQKVAFCAKDIVTVVRNDGRVVDVTNIRPMNGMPPPPPRHANKDDFKFPDSAGRFPFGGNMLPPPPPGGRRDIKSEFGEDNLPNLF